MSQTVSRADLHIHTMASDGTASVSQVLARAEEVGLDLIAITDHDRIDAAQAAQQMAQRNGLHVQVVVGEEISTLQGHLLGLFLQERIRPLRSLRRSIAEIHEQGGIAILAHPLFPHPLCAQEGTIRSYNPTIFGTYPRRRVAKLNHELGLATIGSSDAHVLSAIGRVWTAFEGSSPEALRSAILSRTVSVGSGSDHTLTESPGIFGRQILRNLIGLGQDVAGVTRPLWTLGGERRGRDLGYPGSRRRPARYEPEDER
jgi:predicted metal-dependent phosphoesterase TrpH